MIFKTKTVLDEKLRDYQKIGVRKCWLVSPESETVEVMRIAAEGLVSISLHGVDGTLHSEIFTELELPVREVFR